MCTFAAETESVSNIRELVVAATSRAQSIGCRSVDVFADNYRGLRGKPEFYDLEKVLAHSWKVAVSNFGDVARTDMEKAVLLYSCGGLSSEAYIELLRATATLVEQGMLDREIFYDIQCPFNETSDAWAVLVKKRDDPNVQDIIARARSIFRDNQERLASYDEMLTDENRERLAQFEAAMRGDQASVSSQPQESTIQEAVAQDATKKLDVAETEEVRPPSVRQTKEDPVKVAPANEAQPEEHKRGFVLPVVIGIIAVLVCVGIWFFRRRG